MDCSKRQRCTDGDNSCVGMLSSSLSVTGLFKEYNESMSGSKENAAVELGDASQLYPSHEAHLN